MEEIAAFSHDDRPTEAMYESLARFYERIATIYEGRNGADPFAAISEFVETRR
jgi:hypothetical protein